MSTLPCSSAAMRWLVGMARKMTASGSPRMSLAIGPDQVDVEALERRRLAGIAVAPAVAVLVDADDQLAALSLIGLDPRWSGRPRSTAAGSPPGSSQPSRRRWTRRRRRPGAGRLPAPATVAARRRASGSRVHDGRQRAGRRHRPHPAPAAQRSPPSQSVDVRAVVIAALLVTGTPKACGRCRAPRPPRPARPGPRRRAAARPARRARPRPPAVNSLLLMGERLSPALSSTRVEATRPSTVLRRR